MARPIPIVRETKEQGAASPLPIEKKYTFQNANEDKDKINQAINMLPIYLTSDEDGILTGYEVEVGGDMVNVLLGIKIGAIFQIGSGISFAEYDGTISESDEFTKDLDDITIKVAGGGDPMVFAANTKFVLYPK